MTDNICREAVNATTALDNAIATEGKRTVDNIMSPIRSMIEEEKTATGARKQQLQQKIVSHYAEAGEKAITQEKDAFTTAIKADSSVQTYIRKMSYDEYANFRSEIQRTFGGPQARMTEIEFKNAKIPDITARLDEKGLMTDSINDAFTTMKGEGILSEKNFNQLRALDELADKGTDIIKTGTARQTYKEMKNSLGEQITNEVFAKKIDDNLAKLTDDIGTRGTKDWFFRKLPTRDELKMFDDIKNGKRIPDGNALEASQKMIDKISANGWETIRGTIRPLEELDGPSRIAVTRELNKSPMRWMKTTTGIMTTSVGIVTTAALVLWGIPGTIQWWETSTTTNMAEMYTLFQQFKMGEDSTSDIIDKIANEENFIEFTQLINHLENWRTRWPMDTISKIPWYGEYVINAIGERIDKNTEAIKRNYMSMCKEMESMGIMTKDDTSPFGYRVTKEEEFEETYKKNPSKLFANDANWIKDHSPWEGGSGVYRTGKQGRELTALEAMALYYHDKGEHNVDLTKMGLSFDDTTDETTMNAVRKFGKEHDTKNDETTTPTQETPKNKYDLNQLTEMGLTCNMGNKCNTDTFNRNIENGWRVVKDPVTGKVSWNQPGDPLQGAEILAGAGTDNKDINAQYTIRGSSGGSGSSSGSSSSKTTVTSETGREQQIRSAVRNKEIEVNTEYVNAITENGKTNLNKAKEDKVSIVDVAGVSSAARTKVVNAIPDRMKETKQEGKIDKQEYKEMLAVDEKKTRSSVVEAFRCG